ncbi:MAG: YggS family pyridoxal phosphate-dependent enzyme [Sphaerochaetaceae bacterium]|nr:YggS family pyridoxal phosphate-dependent enzyme [Sphaerochaetaceae bacterium]
MLRYIVRIGCKWHNTTMDMREIFQKLTGEVGNVRIVAVSKTRPLEDIKRAYDAGFRIFGENYVQEIIDKFSDWHPADAQIHMIGHLQTNKVNKVVSLVDMIESVDSLHLLEKIDACAAGHGKIMPVLLEMNTSGETSKSGFSSEKELFDCVEASLNMKNVRICGLMTIGPVNCPAAMKEKLTEQAFAKLASLKVECEHRFPGLCLSELSMGMSGDYMTGVRAGSTIVRIGTLIFGARSYA